MAPPLLLKPSDFDDEVLDLCRRLRAKGHEAWIVGGAVRDRLLGRPVRRSEDGLVKKDVDLATSARPEEVQQAFRRTVPTGIKHGTVTVLMGDHPYEVTTFRSDGAYGDGRHPDAVTFATDLGTDLERRDFTINAMAYDPVDDRFEDRHGGQEDLAAQLIRTIGDPRVRFGEDALRMLRACRFSSQLGFSIHGETLKAIGEGKKNLTQVSAERVRDELDKILLSPMPSWGLEACRQTGLLAIFLPELDQCHGVGQNSFHKYDVYWHILKVLDSMKPEDPLTVRLSGLFHDIAKPQTRRQVNAKAEPVFYNHEVVGAGVSGRVMRRLKYPNETITAVGHLVRHHMFHYTPSWTKGAVRRFIRNVGPEFLTPLFALRHADRLGNGKREATCDEIEIFKDKITEVFQEQSALSIKDLKIGGHDLMEKLFLSPGPILGRILHHLLEKVLDEPELNEPEKLLHMAKEYVDAGAPPPPPEPKESEG